MLASQCKQPKIIAPQSMLLNVHNSAHDSSKNITLHMTLLKGVWVINKTVMDVSIYLDTIDNM